MCSEAFRLRQLSLNTHCGPNACRLRTVAILFLERSKYVANSSMVVTFTKTASHWIGGSVGILTCAFSVRPVNKILTDREFASMCSRRGRISLNSSGMGCMLPALRNAFVNFVKSASIVENVSENGQSAATVAA